MEIIMDTTDGNLRLVVARADLSYVTELTELDSGDIVERQKWQGESAWSAAQRYVSDLIGYSVYLAA